MADSGIMSLKQIEQNVAALSEVELKEFSAWFEKYLAETWDRQMEKDAENGNLNRLVENLGIDLANDATQPLEAGFRQRNPAWGSR